MKTVTKRSIWYNIAIMIFIINFIFWTIFPHETHCLMTDKLDMSCPPHWQLMLFGFGCLGLAIVIIKQL
jgi:hypothetical protein